MIQHYRFALTGFTVSALVASVSLGFWAGFVTAQLRPADPSSPKLAGP
jgi:hypothetical protein